MGIDKGQKAKEIFNTICDSLDTKGWKYKKTPEELKIETGARGEDLPMDLKIQVHEDRMLVLLLSLIPALVLEDKRLDMAVAVSAVNDRLVDGCFDYDIKSGRIGFRMTCSYIESKLGAKLFDYMVDCSCTTIDHFNEKFLMLGAGLISLNDFMEKIG